MTLCNENAPILVNEEMGCNIWLMTVRAPEIATTARPGQFVHVKVPGMEAHILRRPFGVYAADAEAGTVDMMYQVLGFGTEHMTELAAGDAVEMIGPIGRGWQPPEGCKRALIVAGGIVVGKLGRKKGLETDDIYREVARELKHEAEAEAAREAASHTLDSGTDAIGDGAETHYETENTEDKGEHDNG